MEKRANYYFVAALWNIVAAVLFVLLPSHVANATTVVRIAKGDQYLMKPVDMTIKRLDDNWEMKVKQHTLALDLPVGNYELSVTIDGKTYTRKFIVLRGGSAGGNEVTINVD